LEDWTANALADLLFVVQRWIVASLVRSLSSFLLLSSLVTACGGEVTESSLVPPAAPGNGSGENGSSSNASTSGDGTAGAAPVNTATDIGVGQVAAGCARATSRVTLAANLNSAPAVITTPWDPTDPYADADYVSVTTIYDALGREHTLGVVFRKVSANGYDYHAMVDSYVGVPAAVNGTEVAGGTLSFTTGGALRAVTEARSAQVHFEDITAPQPIAIDFGKTIADGGNGYGGTISVSAPTTIVGAWQDGATCGATVVQPKTCTWPLPHATTHVAVKANLDARMDVVGVLASPWSLTAPLATSNFTMHASLYDSLGETHDLALHFHRTGASTWDYHAVIGEADATTSAAPIEVGEGTLSFDASGELLSVSTKLAMSLSFPGATPAQPVTLDFGATTSSAGGDGHMTELASDSAALVTAEDGNALTEFVLASSPICG